MWPIFLDNASKSISLCDSLLIFNKDFIPKMDDRSFQNKDRLTSLISTKLSMDIHTYIHTSTHERTHARTHAHTYVSRYKHTYIHTLTNARTYARTYLRTYVHTFIHTTKVALPKRAQDTRVTTRVSHLGLLVCNHGRQVYPWWPHAGDYWTLSYVLRTFYHYVYDCLYS